MVRSAPECAALDSRALPGPARRPIMAAWKRPIPRGFPPSSPKVRPRDEEQVRNTERMLLALLALGALCVALLGARVAGHAKAGRVELGRARLAIVDREMRAWLRALPEPVRVTWYRTPPARMPSHLRGLEEGVRSALEALSAASDGRLTQLVVDPDEHPEWSEALAAAGAAKGRERRVERDGWREERLWSTLEVACGPRPAALINGLGPAHLPELQRLIRAQVEELQQPRRARIALDAPAGFERFRRELQLGAEVVELDFAGGAALPEAIDLFLWLAPRACGERELAALDRLLARGGSALVAGSAQHGRVTPGFQQVEFEPTGFPAAAFLAHFGLRALDGLLLDAQSAPDGSAPSGLALPQRVPSIARDHDFRTLRGQPNGTLVFDTPSAFEPDPARLAERGTEATILASARAGAVLVPVPDEELPSPALASLPGRVSPQAGLVAILRPSDPWSGVLVALASASPFRDGELEDGRFAHSALARVLLDALVAPERSVASAIARERPAPLMQLAAGQRLRWRLFVVLLPVALALAPFLLRLGRSLFARVEGRAGSARAARLAGARPLALALLVLGGVALAGPRGIDLTRDGAHRPTPAEIETLRELASEEAVVLETWFSARDALPPELRAAAREAERLCAELARRVPGLEHRARAVLAIDDEREAELAALGVPVLSSSSRADERTTLRRYASSLRVLRGDQARSIELARPDELETLRFRIAFALWRLERGREPRIAFAGEPPRLSPAEAALEYERRGLFAPREGDVYSELRALLGRNGFSVESVDPLRASALDAELVLWVQPRRDLTGFLAVLAGELARGGRAIVAAQHFRIRARQLQRDELDLAFWPEPQFADLDLHYLPALGIRLVPELVLDELRAPLALETRVDRPGEEASYVRQPSAQSFLLRAAETGFQPGVRAIAGLGDLLLPGASRIALDARRLAERGLRVEPWIFSSARAWTYAWKGGDIPGRVLEGPSAADGAPPLGEPALLAARFAGSFPAAERVGETQVDRELLLAPLEPGAPEGELLLIGCSEMWRNDQLYDPRFRHDLLALRAVTELALEPRIADFVQRRVAAPGLAIVEPRARALWRIVVLASFPLALLLVGLARWCRR